MTSMDPHFTAPNLIQNQVIGSRPADPLPRLLAQLLERAGGPAMVERAASRPWSSALFEGRRHVIVLRLTGPDAGERHARFIAGLGSTEWLLPGHFVADISVDEEYVKADDALLELCALTIQDR